MPLLGGSCGLTMSAQRDTRTTTRRTQIDRRSAILTVGAAAAFRGKPSVAAGDFDLALAEQVKAAVKTIAEGGAPGQKPQSLEDLVVGILDDGSPEMKAAFLGIASSGAKAAKLKGSSAEAQQEGYRKQGCVAAVARNSAAIKLAMSGTGLACADCSLDGGEAPPRWFIVLDAKGKSNKDLQEEGGVTGRVESATKPGTFVELGAWGGGADVFSLDSFKSSKK
jgi:hypothetical protein